MDLRDRVVLILGGAGLVGQAVARRVLDFGPRRVVVTSLRRGDAEEAVRELGQDFPGVSIEPAWGDLFVPEALKDRPRNEIARDAQARRQLVDDVYDELTDGVFRRSALGALLLETRPDVVVDCINTAGALAYRDVFGSVARLRAAAADGHAGIDAVEEHLSTLYLPQLIRHVQVALRGMTEVGTGIYVKIGTAGTGGMGLNIPFTHSEERPSRVLLAKSGLAGAHTLLLYLMARTPGAPAVKEVKPTAAISWKSIGFGPVLRGGRPIRRWDALEPVDVAQAFGPSGVAAAVDTGRDLEGVYLDAGENGLFSLPEFEALTALGLMEFVTPEEIADNVIREILGHPSGRDVVAALDASTMGPTYRAGVLRSHAIHYMEDLEREHGVEAVGYEMLGPPRLTKLLFEAAVLERLFDRLDHAAELDPAEVAERSRALIERDADLRQRILTAGLPILLPDGRQMLRGQLVRVPQGPGQPLQAVADTGWVDLRPTNWERWRHRLATVAGEIRKRPGLESGSRADRDFGDHFNRVRPGHLAAWIFRVEDRGLRIKR